MAEPVEETREGRRCGTSLRWRTLRGGKFERLDKAEVGGQWDCLWVGLRGRDQSGKTGKRCLQAPGDYPSQTPSYRENCY